MKHITKQQFTDFVRNQEKNHYYAKKKNAKISDETISDIFELLDLDGNGAIDNKEILGIFEGKQCLSQGRSVSDDAVKSLKDNASSLWGSFRT
jgi:Ca2+-binding EF-hand superfamily protein